MSYILAKNASLRIALSLVPKLVLFLPIVMKTFWLLNKCNVGKNIRVSVCRKLSNNVLR